MTIATQAIRSNTRKVTVGAIVAGLATSAVVILTPVHQADAAGDNAVLRISSEKKPITSGGVTYAPARGFSNAKRATRIPHPTPIKNTKYAGAYRGALWGMTSWSEALPNGTYDVTLKMRESYWNAAGKRVFSVKAENKDALTNIDIYKAVGKGAAYDRTFRVTIVDGRLNLNFSAKADSPILSAIVVTKASGSNTTPTTPSTPKPTTPTTPKPTTPTTPKPTTPATPATKNISGLPFKIGVFAHSGAYGTFAGSRADKFEKVIGRKVDLWQVAPQRNEGFAAMLGETRLLAKNAKAQGKKVDFAFPLVTKDQAAQLGRVINEYVPDAYVRFGWEFNLSGAWPWTVSRIGNAAFISGYKASADGLRSTAPKTKLVWNPNSGQGGVAKAMQAYPGSNYVDIIGVDAYDWSGEDVVNGPGQLNEWAKKARELGKRVALPEWGVHRGKNSSGKAEGRGDNPNYINQVLDWTKRNIDIVEYISYFDETSSYIQNSIATGQAPKAGAALKAGLTAIANSFR